MDSFKYPHRLAPPLVPFLLSCHRLCLPLPYPVIPITPFIRQIRYYFLFANIFYSSTPFHLKCCCLLFLLRPAAAPGRVPVSWPAAVPRRVPASWPVAGSSKASGSSPVAGPSRLIPDYQEAGPSNRISPPPARRAPSPRNDAV